jgi:hypothetical protein
MKSELHSYSKEVELDHKGHVQAWVEIHCREIVHLIHQYQSRGGDFIHKRLIASADSASRIKEGSLPYLTLP